MPKRGKKGEKIDYERREVNKRIARATGAAVVYGTIGNLLGRGVEYIREGESYAGKKIEEAEEVIDKVNPRSWYQNAKRSWHNLTGGDTTKYEAEKKVLEQEKIGRRSFLKKILGENIVDHPKTAGTTTGIVYGATKSGIRSHLSGKGRMETARIKNKLQDLEEKISQIEKRNKSLDESIDESYEGSTLMIVGLFTTLAVVIFNNPSLTGNVVASQSGAASNIAALIAIAFSTLLVLIGYIKNRKK